MLHLNEYYWLGGSINDTYKQSFPKSINAVTHSANRIKSNRRILFVKKQQQQHSSTASNGSNARSTEQSSRILQQGTDTAAANDMSNISTSSSANNTDFSNSRGLSDLVELIPFDVQIALSLYEEDTIQIFDVSTIVTQWMNDIYTTQFNRIGFIPERNYAKFQAVVLLKRQPPSAGDDGTTTGSNNDGVRQRLRRTQQLLQNEQYADEQLSLTLAKGKSSNSKVNRGSKSKSFVKRYVQEEQQQDPTTTIVGTSPESSSTSTAAAHLYTAQFKGGAYFTRMDRYTRPVPEDDVLSIQEFMFANNATSLLQNLQYSNAVGLGPAVVDVRVFLTANNNNNNNNAAPASSPFNNPTTSATTSTTGTNTNNNDAATNQLEIIIISAIGVAVIAFLFLLAAIFWAYQYDKKNRDAYQVGNVPEKNAVNDSNSSSKKKKKKSGDNTDSETASPKTSDENDSPPKTILYQPRYPAYPTEIIAGNVVENNMYPESTGISDSIHLTNRNENNVMMVLIDDDVKSQLTGYTESVAPEMPVTTATTLSYNNTAPSFAADDEVSASLTQYYRSGMGKVAVPLNVIENVRSQATSCHASTSINFISGHAGYLRDDINDAASVSSMESYGYSLDGTIPTVLSRSAVGVNNATATTGHSSFSSSNINTGKAAIIAGNKSSLSTTYNNGNNSNNNPYSTSKLERIGGLPVEPDLRHIEHYLTIDDVVGVDNNDHIAEIENESVTGGMDDLCTVDGSLLTLSNVGKNYQR